MPYTLVETLRQIDPFVQLTNGNTVAEVCHWLKSADSNDQTEYAMTVDSVGRLLIYRLDLNGRIIRPPAFIEEKPAAKIPPAKQQGKPTDFGFSILGQV
jgi:hypothetical protein